MQSPFSVPSESKKLIDSSAQVVFVSDMFVEDYVGGAELTTQALIDSCQLKYEKIHSKEISLETLASGYDKFWIFGNFSSMNHDLIPSIVSNLSYSVLEYDYKFCRYRSLEKHKFVENKDCDCHNEMHGKLISAFYYGARSLWWMSEKQLDIYLKLFPFLNEKKNCVLSSVFDDKFFLQVHELREAAKNQERKKWVVLESNSWIKGTDAATNWCIENKKDFEVVGNLSYDVLLLKLAQSKGFVYLPHGGDTCPRMVIEARLLDCELHINENVQHANEEWFATSNTTEIEEYLFGAREMFWNGIKSDMEWQPTLSGYTTTLNCITQKYPWRECVSSLLDFCDQVVVVDGGSTDGTWEELLLWSESSEKLLVKQVTRDWEHPRFAVFDGAQKAEARKLCTQEFCWQQDADEVVIPEDYEKVKKIAKTLPSLVDLACLPVVEYWGSKDKVRCDVTPWKWRLSRNKEYITHGIPAELRKFDESGELYALQGTDGCDMVNSETFERIPHATFYTNEVHNIRMHALHGNMEALKAYQQWFNSIVKTMPAVRHYSWIDIGRKIRTYRDYWTKHWMSLYNIEQLDTVENNKFFDKCWRDVSEEEIDELAKRLSSDMCGWIFHNKIDWSKKTPCLTIDE